MLIRPCQAEDFDQILVLLQQLWPSLSLDSALLYPIYAQGLASDMHRYLCAIDGATIIGFGSLSVKNSLWLQGHLGHIDELIVDERYRGQGIGAALLEALVAHARACDCRRVELESGLHRVQSHQFYEKHGFEHRAKLFSRVLARVEQ